MQQRPKIGALARERLVVEDPDRRKRIVASIHNTSHMGLNRTTDMVSGKYYWPGLTSDVKAYVSSLILYALHLPICEYLGDNVHNGWADIFERLAISSDEGYADLALQHPNIDTLPDMDSFLSADIVTSEVEEAIIVGCQTKARDLTISCPNIAVQLSPPI